MIIEAYGPDSTKYKVGMQAKLKGENIIWYIASMWCDTSGKLKEINFISADMTEFCTIRSFQNVTLTGQYEGDFLKLARKLADKK